MSDDPELRQAALAAAATIVDQQGAAALTAGAVARRLVVAEPRIDALFPDRGALVRALASHAVSSFSEALAAVPITADAVGDLHAQAWAYRRWALEDPMLYAVIFGGRLIADPAMVGAPSPLTDEVLQPLLLGIERAMDAGYLRRDKPLGVAIAIWAGLHGIVGLERAVWPDAPMTRRDEMYERHLHTLVAYWM